MQRSHALVILLLLGVAFGANHVAARVAFDHGVGLLFAVLSRSGVAALALLGVLLVQRTPLALPPGRKRWMLLLGALISLQSLLLYSAVARIPVALALLAFNTFPLLFTLLSWVLGGPAPGWRAGAVMGLILLGLALALDAPARWAGVSDGPSLAAGVALGLCAAVVFACGLWVTENRLKALPGPLRSFATLGIVFVLMLGAGAAGLVPGGMAYPHDAPGWTGLVLLTVLYGGAFSMLFILMPRLDMARNAPAANIEPIAALALAWIFLDQSLKPSQLLGAAVVVGGIVLLARLPKH
jgi:drug/metabolite transporter (DMT)-like permease